MKSPNTASKINNQKKALLEYEKKRLTTVRRWFNPENHLVNHLVDTVKCDIKKDTRNFLVSFSLLIINYS